MDEYIKKADVLQVIERNAMWNRSFYALHDDIEDMTAAYIVPVRHGRWEMRGGKRYCTSCGERACVTRDSEDFWYTIGTPYCPNCGAKMDEEA